MLPCRTPRSQCDQLPHDGAAAPFAGPSVAVVLRDVGINLVQFESDTAPEQPSLGKRQKTEAEALVRRKFTLLTCAATATPEEISVLTTMSVDAFITTHVLGGVPLTKWHEWSQHEIRQNVSDLVHNVYLFWCKDNIVHFAGLLAAVHDGHGHGTLQMLVADRHTGCTGRWDMFFVLASYMLNEFPATYVSVCCMPPKCASGS